LASRPPACEATQNNRGGSGRINWKPFARHTPIAFWPVAYPQQRFIRGKGGCCPDQQAPAGDAVQCKWWGSRDDAVSRPKPRSGHRHKRKRSNVVNPPSYPGRAGGRVPGNQRGLQKRKKRALVKQYSASHSGLDRKNSSTRLRIILEAPA